MKKILLIIVLVAISMATPKYRKIILENDLKVILQFIEGMLRGIK